MRTASAVNRFGSPVIATMRRWVRSVKIASETRWEPADEWDEPIKKVTSIRNDVASTGFFVAGVSDVGCNTETRITRLVAMIEEGKIDE